MNKLLWVVALAVVTAAAYSAFLAWDSEYQIDPVTKVASGPYEAWQVIGLGAVCVIAAAIAGWHRQTLLVVLVMPLVLMIAFILTAMADKSTGDGLFMVGAIMMFVGSFVGLGIVSAVVQAIAASKDLK